MSTNIKEGKTRFVGQDFAMMKATAVEIMDRFGLTTVGGFPMPNTIGVSQKSSHTVNEFDLIFPSEVAPGKISIKTGTLKMGGGTVMAPGKGKIEADVVKTYPQEESKRSTTTTETQSLEMRVGADISSVSFSVEKSKYRD